MVFRVRKGVHLVYIEAAKNKLDVQQETDMVIGLGVDGQKPSEVKVSAVTED